MFHVGMLQRSFSMGSIRLLHLSRFNNRQICLLSGSIREIGDKADKKQSYIASMDTKSLANRKLLHSSAPLASSTSSPVVVYTDAASEVAAAGFWKSKDKWYIYNWDPRIIQANPGIAWMEFFAIALAARLWGSQWCNRDVYIKTDSQSSVSAWHHGHFHSQQMEVLKKKLQQTINQHGFNLTLSHIHGDDNPADALSRDKLASFLREHKTADQTSVQIPSRLVQDLLP